MRTRNNTKLKTSVLLKTYGPLVGDLIEDTSAITELVFNENSLDVIDKTGRVETIEYLMLNHNEMEQELLIWTFHNETFIALGLSSFEYH